MTFTLPSRLAAICLASIALTSCASKGPTSTDSYSAIVQAEVAKQKAADCAFFAFNPLGPLPPEIAGQLAAVPPDNRTPDQVALIAWMNRDTQKNEQRQNYCGG